MSKIIDIHPHILSNDETRYPPAPLFGKRSDWSQETANPVENLIAEMDAAGVAKAAVVHSSTTYGFDNSYVVDGCNQYPDRLVAVGSVDMVAPERLGQHKLLFELAQRVAHLGEGRGGVEMLLEPGQRELHRTASRAEKP